MAYSVRVFAKVHIYTWRYAVKYSVCNILHEPDKEVAKVIIALLKLSLSQLFIVSPRRAAPDSIASYIVAFVLPPCQYPSPLTCSSLGFFLLLLSTERIVERNFKDPPTNSKARQTTSEDVWVLFITNNTYSNKFNIFLL